MPVEAPVKPAVPNKDNRVVNGPKFAYTGTGQPGHQRKNSFCIFNPTEKPLSLDAATYQKAELLGQGAFGKVSKMVAPNGNAIAVKEFCPEKVAIPSDWTIEQITAFINQSIENMKKEAQCNAAYFGMGYYHRATNEPVRAKREYSEWKLVSYPRVYVAMEYVEATELSKFEIDSPQTYLEIVIAILHELKKMHVHLMHLDIHRANVLISRDHKNNINVRFCDFSISKFSENDLLNLKDLNLDSKPPEYQSKSSIAPNRNQDIYCTGLMLRKVLASCKFDFPKSLKHEINLMLSDMAAFIPRMRLTSDQAISEAYKCYYRYLFRVERDAQLKKFPSAVAVDKWCYSQGFISEISNSKSIDQVLKWRDAYEKLISENIAWSSDSQLGAKQLIQSLNNEVMTLSQVLEKASSNKRLAVLHYLRTVADTYITSLFWEMFKQDHVNVLNIFIDDQYNLLDSKSYQSLLNKLFSSARKEFSLQFATSEEAIRKWCNFAVFQCFCNEKVLRGLKKYEKEDLSLFLKYKTEEGPTQLMLYVNDRNKFVDLIKHVDINNRIHLINVLAKENKTYLATILFNAKDYQVVCDLVDPAHQKQFNILWLESKKSQLQIELESKENNADVNRLDKWCYCEQLHYRSVQTDTIVMSPKRAFKVLNATTMPTSKPGVTELNENVVTDIKSLVALLDRTPPLLIKKLLAHIGVDHLRKMVKTRQDLIMLMKKVSASNLKALIHLLGKEYLSTNYKIGEFSAVELQEYIALTDAGLGAAETNNMLKVFAKGLIDKIQVKDKNKAFEQALRQIDSAYKSGSEIAYKRIVLAFNAIYIDTRQAEGWGCTLFGGYSKSQKLAAAKKLADNAKLSDTDKEVVMQGRMRMIGSRLGYA